MGVLAGNANRYGNLAFQPLLSAPRGIGSGGTPSAFLGALALSAGQSRKFSHNPAVMHKRS